MRISTLSSLLVSALVLLAATPSSAEEIRMASGPALSPDGADLAFAWRGDIWRVASEGGSATRLTRHPGDDREPSFSPDGKWIAFTSDRFPGRQVYVMSARGGTPRQITWNTNGYALMGWFPDGKSVLVRGRSDRSFTRDYRFYRISVKKRAAPEMLFDAYGVMADVSHDGKRILFTREGVSWWRKGYTGSQAGQVWVCDLDSGELSPVVRSPAGARWPRFLSDGGILWVGVSGGAFNLLSLHEDPGKPKILTRYEEDSVIAPAVSRDGNTIVYRHLFDLYLLTGEEPVRLKITASTDDATPKMQRKMLSRADAAAFTADGLEIAIAAGGDLWVMDTVLKEPRRLTATPEEEREPLFLSDGSAILFVSDRDGQSDIWRIERADPERWWWRSDAFRLTRVTDDAALESELALSPDGKRISYVRGQEELVTADPDGAGVKVVATGSSGFDYSWSPDGDWLAYSADDSDSNRDVWITASDGEGEPTNVSRHPYEDWGPAWSPDGKILAFTGARRGGETDIFYVYLIEADEKVTKRDRTLSDAVEKMAKARKSGAKPSGAKTKPEEKAEEKALDLLGIHERVRRIPTRDVSERNLFWSPDGKKLAFEATINAKRGTYTVTFPDSLKASLLTTTRGSNPRWLKKGSQILWLVGGSPASSVGSRTTTYAFRAKQSVDRERHQAVAFDLAWRWMRDWFYDDRMNNRDWGEIRGKYRDQAASAPDNSTFGRIVSLMLGELNASHLGFSVSRSTWRSPDQWSEVTAHLGVRFDPAHSGPGLRVEYVIPDGPADRSASDLTVGDVVLSIDQALVGPETDLTTILNGATGREVVLAVAGESGEERDVRIRPSTMGAMRGLLYREWVRENRRKVAQLSGGTLGYVHVAGMNWSSFDSFERELYAEGFGKKGLLIDVRFNGGGFTADHLLTVLTQPVHAIAVRRGGGPGYPQDRTVYARWTKPVTVLVNQASFSNAEIFAHAVKTIGRGRLVGVPSAGGVISTSATRVLDMGTLRLPLRGWFLANTGEDLERNGVQPHFVIWPEPGDFAAGRDAQLTKAVEVLQEDVEVWEARPQPKLRKASER